MNKAKQFELLDDDIDDEVNEQQVQDEHNHSSDGVQDDVDSDAQDNYAVDESEDEKVQGQDEDYDQVYNDQDEDEQESDQENDGLKNVGQAQQDMRVAKSSSQGKNLGKEADSYDNAGNGYNQIQNNLLGIPQEGQKPNVGRVMRPQSAGQTNQANFQNQAQHIPGATGSVLPAGYSQQQLGVGYSQQQLMMQQQNSFTGQPIQMNNQQNVNQQMFYPPPAGTKQKIGGKRRPMTAGRRNNLGRRIGASNSSNNVVNIPMGQGKLPIEVEVSKFRPRVVHQERERLYDDVMRQRIATNVFKDENLRLRTKLQMAEHELGKKDRLIDDLLLQSENLQGVGKMAGKRTGQMKIESHLEINLKRKVRGLTNELIVKTDEIEALKRNIRTTRQGELEVEIKLYGEECIRLRRQLEDVMKSKDTFADPRELKIIKEEFRQRDSIIAQLQRQNQDLMTGLQKKDEECRHLAGLVGDMERRLKKAQTVSKAGVKSKQALKEKETQLSNAREQLKAANNQQSKLTEQVRKLSAASAMSQSRDRVQSAQPTNAIQSKVTSLEFENRKLKSDLEDRQIIVKKQAETLRKTKQDLSDKNEELGLEQADKLRFKDTSENYMNQVSALELQLEAADVKPKSKMSQRPKDTCKRDQSHSSIHTTKPKRVDQNQIREACQHIRLKLLKQKLNSNQVSELLFDEYNGSQEISILQLKSIFDSLGVRSALLARYLIEPRTGNQDITQNDAKSTQRDVLDLLCEEIGLYKLFEEGAGEETQHTISERNMQMRVAEKFGNAKSRLAEVLAEEDISNEGFIDLQSLKAAINGEYDNIDDQLMDYLLYCVFIRSESADKMQYKFIMNMLEESLSLKQRASSAKRNKRPESSSPEKLKQRNPPAASAGISNGLKNMKMNDSSDESDKYSEQEVGIKEDDDESKPVSKKEEAEDEYSQDQDEVGYESTPSAMKKQIDKEEEAQGDEPEEDNYEEAQSEFDDAEMIDTAERIFVKMAELMFDNKVTCRMAFKEHTFVADLNGQEYDLISPMGFLQGIKEIGIDNLSESEVTYLLKVLSKNELDGAIMLQELQTIMENFGLYDDDEDQEEASPEANANVESAQSSPEQNSSVKKQKKKKDTAVDLTKLDNESIEVMAMLMLYCIKHEMRAHDVFEEVIFLQNIKSKSNKHQTVEIMKAEDFYRVLVECGIRQDTNEHANLNEQLQLSPNFPDLLTLKQVKKTLEAMQENKKFMAAIEEDLMQEHNDNEYDDEQAEELRRIQEGVDESQESPSPMKLSRAPAGQIGMSRPAVMEDEQDEYSDAAEEIEEAEKKEEADYSDDEEF